MPLALTRYRLNNIQRWMMDEKRIMATQLNGVEWSYLSPPDSRFLTYQIKEKLSVGEMRQISGWRWLSVGIQHHFGEPFSLLLSYTPYDLSDWLNVECSCGGTWFTEPKAYSYSACALFTFTSESKYPVRFDFYLFFIPFSLVHSDSLLMFKLHGYMIQINLFPALQNLLV